MNIDTINIECETAKDFDAVEALAALAFGPGRFTRTAFRLREGVPHKPDLSFVARHGGQLVGGVRQTEIKIGHSAGLLLGPLVVAPEFKNWSIGRKLMTTAVSAARDAGQPWIILVGDKPYYGRFGFEIVEPGQVTLPGPVDPNRLLICKLDKEVCKGLSGMVRQIGK